MNKRFIYLLILALSVLFIYFVGGFVIIFASFIVIFDKCFLGRIKIIHGIEFTTISILLVAIKYDLITSILFCVLIFYILPAAINFFLGDKWITNKDFKLVKSIFGLVVNVISVLIVFCLRSLDLFFIMLAVLLFRHTIYILKGKLTQVGYILDYLGFTINILFNLGLIYFFKSFWLWMLV